MSGTGMWKLLYYNKPKNTSQGNVRNMEGISRL